MSLSVRKSVEGAPAWLERCSLEEMKRGLVEGELLHSLQEFFQERGETLTGLTLSEERYEGEYAFLVLILGFKETGRRIAYEKEWVFQYLVGDDLSGEGPMSNWLYPEDPELPVLARLYASPGFLQEIAWEKSTGEGFPENDDFSMRRLLYNPGCRATFLVASEKTGRRFILKIVRPKEWSATLEKIAWMDRAALHEQILFPKMVAASSREHLFLYDYLPGLRIDRLGPGREEWRGAIFEEVATLLNRLHQTALHGLPRWSPYQEIGILSLFAELLQVRAPGLAAAVQPMLQAVSEDLIERNRDGTQAIHNSFSAKHLLYHPERPGGRKLAVLDWDSAALGPREKDVGSFLAGFSQREEEALSFIRQYDDEGGGKLDLPLVYRFIQVKRLIKICRKALRGDLTIEKEAKARRELDRLANEARPIRGSV